MVGAMGALKPTRGRRWLVVACEHKMVFVDLVSQMQQALGTKHTLDGKVRPRRRGRRAPCCLVPCGGEGGLPAV